MTALPAVSLDSELKLLNGRKSILMDKAGTATRPEDIFIELFAQVFGLEKAERLSHEFGVLDIYNQPRRIDYALEIAGKRLAFEIDGLAWHHPNVLSVFEYEDQLLRQNSLIADGWRVFRWTDHEIVEEPDRVKEELARFLESIPGLLDDADFLPKRECVQFDLFEHQQKTLDYLAQQRAMGKTMALVVHATGAGSTFLIGSKFVVNACHHPNWNSNWPAQAELFARLLKKR